MAEEVQGIEQAGEEFEDMARVFKAFVATQEDKAAEAAADGEADAADAEVLSPSTPTPFAPIARHYHDRNRPAIPLAARGYSR